LKLWQIAALTVAGLVVGEVRPGYLADLFRNATLNVFLPALIFEAAWQLELRLMRRSWQPIVLLAIPGVIVTGALIALIVHGLAGVALGGALVLGAVLAATDPVAVTAIFRRLDVPPALATIVESESLLNDAIAVVAYRAIIVAVTASAGLAEIAHVGYVALLGAVAGIVAGMLAGYLGSFALRRNVHPVAQTLASFTAAYGVYFACDAVGWSGIFGVIACALVMRELQRRYQSVGMASSVERAWHIAATIANASLFFLAAASVEPAHLWSVRSLLGITIGAVLFARTVLAYGLLAIAPRMLRTWKTVVRLAGVRGALSLALALGVPSNVPGRETIVDATFAVVIATVLVGTLTYEKRIARLDLDPPGGPRRTS
jgi:CPA1 family monovalent cation:H+ antiporter